LIGRCEKNNSGACHQYKSSVSNLVFPMTPPQTVMFYSRHLSRWE